jgi:hypothetical protein
MCDAAAAGTAVGKVLIRNHRTRVTEWRFAGRGAKLYAQIAKYSNGDKIG